MPFIFTWYCYKLKINRNPLYCSATSSQGNDTVTWKLLVAFDLLYELGLTKLKLIVYRTADCNSKHCFTISGYHSPCPHNTVIMFTHKISSIILLWDCLLTGLCNMKRDWTRTMPITQTTLMQIESSISLNSTAIKGWLLNFCQSMHPCPIYSLH